GTLAITIATANSCGHGVYPPMGLVAGSNRGAGWFGGRGRIVLGKLPHGRMLSTVCVPHTTSRRTFMSARMGALALLALFAIVALPTYALATFSIVARDPDTGEIGVAVQSHYFAVGPIVPWAEPGVGAVATQSLVEVSYGPKGLELMRN